MTFQNKNVLVTGGNSGIGLAIAKAFAQKGAKVAISGRNQATLNSALNALGDGHIAIQADIQRDQDRKNLFDRVSVQFNHLDTLVVNAGVAQFAPLDQVNGAFFDTHFDTNVKGALFTVKEALPYLKAGSTVIFISSIVKDKGFPGSSVYTATKGAVSAMAKALAAELAPQGIRVNTISPGPIDTPIYDRFEVPEEDKPEMKQHFTELVPLKRFGQPEEVAQVALLLASDEAGYLVGADIPVDGGLAQL